jgi:hypothetical protein
VQTDRDLVEIFHGAHRGDRFEYTVLRLQSQEMVNVAVAPIPSGPGPALLRPGGQSASSRCSWGRRCGCAARIIRRRCISSGCASPSLACSPSRSAAGSTRSIASSTGATWCRC